MKFVGVWFVLTAVNVAVVVPRDTVYPVGVGPVAAGCHDTLIMPLLAESGTAATLIGTPGGVQTGLAGTSAELGEVQVPLLTVTT